ncbi:type II secretion system F family protein [Nesterenkonia sp. E16_7]|uniref:type II secretion system F family protein n=1 Tax=unclassified Nesterenkonia TaxID=2629769 RepID=UPI001A90FA89|nr:type II secretion system F family protein [Nesterenkonia sp. E16_10]MBO0598705.1 type II secretion system F family protein [Nesterenkonia sp. E16_7]
MNEAILGWVLICGLGLGLGLVTMLRALPVNNQPSFSARVAPYLRSTDSRFALADSVSEPTRALGVIAKIMAPVLRQVLGQLDRFSLDTQQLSHRLEQANSRVSPNDYRLQQLGLGVLGALLGTLASLLGVWAGSLNGFSASVIVLGLAGLGVALRDNLLTSQIRRRQARMLTEFPTIAEMIALAVSAGEGAPGAFSRVGRLARGELAFELTRVLHQTQAGTSFSTALKQMSTRVGSAPISRFLEGVIVAMERGTPLAEVMHAQALDVRELARRELIETAGKKEIGMLVPLVFGVLPLTVLFAIYPGLSLLEIGI